MSGKPAWMTGLKKKKNLKHVESKGGSINSRDATLAGLSGEKKLKSVPKVSSGMSDYAKQRYRKEQAAKKAGKSFVEALDPQSLVRITLQDKSLHVSLVRNTLTKCALAPSMSKLNFS